METYTWIDKDGSKWQATNHSALGKELVRLASKNLEHELFVAELISRLGLDREAIDREGLPVGNEILKTLDKMML